MAQIITRFYTDENVAQIIARFGYSLFGKAKSGSTKVEKVDYMPLLQTAMLLKEQFKQQFNQVGNTREEQMAS